MSQEEQTISGEHVSCGALYEVSGSLEKIHYEQDCASAVDDRLRVGGGKELELSGVQESHACEQPTSDVLITETSGDPIKGVNHIYNWYHCALYIDVV